MVLVGFAIVSGTVLSAGGLREPIAVSVDVNCFA
jgi:hypothetical protein